MAQAKIVDIVNPYQQAKDQKASLETQLTAANATLAEKGPEIKAALGSLPSKAVWLQGATGKVTVYLLDPSTTEGFRALDPDSSDTTVDVPDAPTPPPPTPPASTPTPTTPPGPTPAPGGPASA